MHDAESSIIARVQAGDREAFRPLVEQHSRSVFRLAYRMTGNQSDAEDVVQEAFLRAFKQIHTFDHSAAFGTWLYRIAANYALDLMRSRQRHRSQESVDSEIFLASRAAAAGDPLPDRLAYGGQLRHHVDAALQSLSEQERTAFVLRHFEGQSIEEIGLTLGLGSSAAKHSIFRAVRKLRRALEPVVGGAS